MKKLAIAAAVAAMATAASAQNVSVYGVIDTTVQSFKADSASAVTRSQDNIYATSRIGFRGTEDLGGGLKANFQLEGRVRPSAGTAGSATANQTFSRESWLGLSGSFGEIRAGLTDLSQQQGMDGLAAPRAGGFGDIPVNGTSIEIGTDSTNAVRYISPSVAGLQIEVGHSTGNGVDATTDANASVDSVSAIYRSGNFRAGIGHSRLDATTTVAKRDGTTYAVGYDFGFANVGLVYAKGDNSATADVDSKAMTASVSVPLGSGVEAHGVYGTSENGSSTTDNKGKGYTVALVKDLSKRTKVYTHYTSVTNDANSSMTMTGTTAPAAAGGDTKVYGVGISHTF